MMPFLEDHDHKECPDCEGDGRMLDEDGQPSQRECPKCEGTGDVRDGDD